VEVELKDKTLKGGIIFMEDVKRVEGFFKSLFDFSFSSFITSRVIKILYILFVLGAALGALGSLLEVLLPRWGPVFLP